MARVAERKRKMNKDDRNNNVKRERLIMIATSALVLTVLTATGAYVRNHNRNNLDNGYELDFNALENHADNKAKEIARDNDLERLNEITAQMEKQSEKDLSVKVDSDDVKIPGLTEEISTPVDQSGSKTMRDGAENKETKNVVTSEKKDVTAQQNTKKTQQTAEQAPLGMEAEGPGKQETEIVAKEVQPTAAQSPILSEELHFDGSMVKPVSGAPLIAYSMDHSVYFATLDQYKYNPAVIYGASEGETVVACAAGRVSNVYNDVELGHVLVLDLGDGYQAKYGQVENIEVAIGKMVEAGTKLATVAAPTKYYVVEGTNLYFQILKDGKSVDPGLFIQ